jgi:predicted RNase H-like HicB family nuclease
MKYTKLSRQVIIEPDETGGYVVSCPSLPGCHSQGETIDEALANIREAIELYLEVIGRGRSAHPAGRSGSSAGSGMSKLPVISGECLKSWSYELHHVRGIMRILLTIQLAAGRVRR